MKKRTLWILAATAVLMSGCGVETEPIEIEPLETVVVESEETKETEEIQIEESEATNAPVLEVSSEAQEEGVRTDHFQVDPKETEAFALKVKAAVAEEDLEALADLAAFPLYLGFTDGSRTAESREELISMGKETIFTEEWKTSVSQADETSLPPSEAGFVLSGEGGGPNLVFGLREGELAIVGMNY